MSSKCENDGHLIERCDCGSTDCTGWGHLSISRHWCPPDWIRKPYPAPRQRATARGYGGYRLPPGRRGSTT